jgi:hypothetical protein
MDAKDGNSAKAWTWKGSRLQGLFILILGFATGYFSIILPLQQAYSKAPEIYSTFKLAFLSPGLVILGILAIIVPSVTSDQTFLLSGPTKLSFAGWILVIALLIVGVGTYYLLDQQLSSLGYK